MKPDVDRKVHNELQNQKRHHDNRTKQREFKVGDKVNARNYANGPTWLPGQVTAQNGPLSYKVKLHDGRVWRRHTDQLIKRYQSCNTETLSPTAPLPDIPFFEQVPNVRPEGEGAVRGIQQQPQPQVNNAGRPRRVIKPPQRYGFD